MELDILGRNQRRLPCAFPCHGTFAISSPHFRCAKIASHTLHLTIVPMLINYLLQVLKNSLEKSAMRDKFKKKKDG
jgi:hypothetical protein